MSKIKFGPAGVPIQCKKSSSIEGVKCCRELGLGAMEIQFGRGVRMKEELASKIKKVAEDNDISLSCHAPYFVNLCSPDKEKIATSHRSLFNSGEIMHYAGGKLFAFHPGFYQTLSKEEAYKNAVKNLKSLKEKFDQHSITRVKFGAETAGKKASFGGLDEVIKLSQELDFVKPVLDLGHVHARGDMKLRSKKDYYALFNKLDKELPNYLSEIHCHFEEIEYSEKGERNHLELGSNNEPPYKPFLEVLVELGCAGTVICETPKIDIDAQKMQSYYLKKSRGKKK